MCRNPTLIAHSRNKMVNIYVDQEESGEIMPFILTNEANFETFYLFQNLLYENRRNKGIYKKENISSKCKNLFAIRFMLKGQNDRIYCLEFHDGKRRIVLTRLVIGKKTDHINKKLRNSIEPLCSRKYKFK